MSGSACDHCACDLLPNGRPGAVSVSVERRKSASARDGVETINVCSRCYVREYLRQGKAR